MGRGELLQLSGKITHNLWIFLLFPQFARQTKRNAGCMRGVCGVKFSRFSAPLVGSPGESCVAEKTKRGRDKGSKRQRVKESKGQRDKGSKRQRVKETKGQRDEERKRQRDEKTKTASPPIHLLFTSYSPPIRVLFTASSPPNSFKSYSIRVQKHSRDSCPKQFYTREHRFVRGR